MGSRIQLSDPSRAQNVDPAQLQLPRVGLALSGGGVRSATFVLGLMRAMAQTRPAADDASPDLTRNGRYLTPGGSRDIGIAVVTCLRARLAIHAELMFACVGLGLLVSLPHLWQHSLQVLDANAWKPWYTARRAWSVAMWTALAPGLIAGFSGLGRGCSHSPQPTKPHGL